MDKHPIVHLKRDSQARWGDSQSDGGQQIPGNTNLCRGTKTNARGSPGIRKRCWEQIRDHNHHSYGSSNSTQRTGIRSVREATTGDLIRRRCRILWGTTTKQKHIQQYSLLITEGNIYAKEENQSLRWGRNIHVFLRSSNAKLKSNKVSTEEAKHE